jgi:hypothetical protein
MKRKLQLHTKTKVKLRNSVKLVYAGAALSVMLIAGWVIYSNFGTSTESKANEQTGLPDFNWRRKLSFNNELVKGGETLLNFPLLIQLSDPEFRSIANGGKVAHPKGYDIRFTKADGLTTFPSQLDSYNPLTGEISAWVLLDTLSEKSAKNLYVYYSNASIRSELPNILWSDAYRGIWHMSDLHASNNRKLRATIQGTSEAIGKIGNARLFDAARLDAAFFSYAEELDLKADFSLSAWVYLNEQNREQVLLSNQSDRPGGYRLFISSDNKLGVDYVNSNGKRISISGVIGGEELDKERWYYVAATYSLKDNLIHTYVDGLSDRSLAVIDAPGNTASALQIGRDQFNNKTYFNGLMDEVRIAAQARSQAWLATELYNQTVGKSLFTLGSAEEMQLTSASIQRNKAGLNLQEAAALSQQEKANTLRGKKLPTSGEAPVTLTTSAEAIQARMNNIRRVAKENGK